MFKRLAVTIVFAHFTLFLCAQEKESAKPWWLTITMNPVYQFNNATKIDLVLQKPNQKLHYLADFEIYGGAINSNIYRNKNEDDERVFDKIGGFGLGAGLRYSLDEKNSNPNSTYVSLSAVFRRLNFKLDGPMYYYFTDYGTTYLTYGRHQKNVVQTPVLLVLDMGKNWEIGRFVAGVSFGVGYKFINAAAELINTRDFEEYKYGYLSSGFNVQFGVSVGLRILK